MEYYEYCGEALVENCEVLWQSILKYCGDVLSSIAEKVLCSIDVYKHCIGVL